MIRAAVAFAFAIGIGIACSAGEPQSYAAVQNSSTEMYQSVYNGWKWWHVYCYRCHGTNAIATTVAPDLFDPNAKLPLAIFLKKVRNGSPDNGMQAWDKVLDDKQITQLYYYVRARADKVLPPGR